MARNNNNWLDFYNNTFQQGGKISVSGYKKNSKDKNEKSLTIPGSNITMDNVPHPVMAYPQNGQPTMMYPGQQYQFPGSQYVQEIPIRQVGGPIGYTNMNTHSQPTTTSNIIPLPLNVLPETIVYGTKDNNTQNFLDMLGDKTPSAGQNKNQTSIDSLPHITHPTTYENAWRSWIDNGKPKIMPLRDRNQQRSFYTADNVMSLGYLPKENEFVTETPYDAHGNRNPTFKGWPNQYFPEENYIAELSHAKQNHDNHIEFEDRNIVDNSWYDKESQYDIPGTIEYEAHKQIEPLLKEKYDIGKSHFQSSHVPRPIHKYGGSQYVNEVPVRMQQGGYIPPKQQQEVQTRNYIPPIQGPGFTNNIVLAGKPWEGKPTYIAPQQQNTGTMQAAAPKRSTINKAGQILRHPMTAVEYKMRDQDIPDYLEYGDKNKFDNAIDIINPMTYIDAGKRVVTAENFRDPNQSFGEALLKTGLDAAMVYGVGKPLANGITKGEYSFANPLGKKAVVNVPVNNELYATQYSPEFKEATWKFGPMGGRKLGAQYKDFYNKWDDLLARRFDYIDRDLVRFNTLKFDPSLLIEEAQSSKFMPGITYGQSTPRQQEQPNNNSGLQFHLNNTPDAQVQQPTKQPVRATKQTTQQKPIHHIGEGNYIVVGSETPDGQFIYHYPTRAQADSVVNSYQQGGQMIEDKNSGMDWLSQDEGPQSMPHQKQRKYHGRKQSRVDRSTYLPHPNIPHMQVGGGYYDSPNPNQGTINYMNSLTPEQIQQNLIQGKQNRTPSIGQQPTWQDKVRNSMDLTHILPSGALSEVGRVGNFIGYPATAAVNLTQPSKYFEGKSNKLEGVQEMFMDALATTALAKPIRTQFKAGWEHPSSSGPTAYTSGELVDHVANQYAEDQIRKLYKPKITTGVNPEELQKAKDLRDKLQKEQAAFQQEEIRRMQEGYRKKLQGFFEEDDKSFKNRPYYQTKHLHDVINDPESFNKIRPQISNYEDFNPLHGVTSKSLYNQSIDYGYPEDYIMSKEDYFKSLYSKPVDKGKVADYITSKSSQQKMGGQIKNDWLKNY